MPLQQMGDFSFNHADQQDKLYQTMTAAEIKAAFDSRGNELRAFINNLISILNSTEDGNSGADNIAATPISGSPSTVQGMLEWLKTQIDNTALGQLPDGSITDTKLSDDPGQIKDRVNNMLQIDSNITLTAANWVDDTATSGYWIYDVTDAEVTADTIVDVYIQRASMQTAIDAGVQGFCESSSGSYRLFAESQPASDITIDVKKTRQVVS